MFVNFVKSHSMKKYAIALASLSGVGALMMGYLWQLHGTAATEAFCDLGSAASCSIVNQSIYAEVFGIPIALLGGVFFLLILVLSLPWSRPRVRPIFFLSILALVPSLYLSVIEVTVIHSVCVVCEVSKLVMLALAFIAYRAVKHAKIAINKKEIITIVLLGLFSVGVLYFVQRPKEPALDYTAFAQCLTEHRLVMYGSVTCAACARQRQQFGASFSEVEEIECDPRNAHAEVERCIAKGIERTPTWILENETGETITMLPSGVQSFDVLSELSNCDLPTL
jgi:uncharacterized membrane protein